MCVYANTEEINNQYCRELFLFKLSLHTNVETVANTRPGAGAVWGAGVPGHSTLDHQYYQLLRYSVNISTLDVDNLVDIFVDMCKIYLCLNGLNIRGRYIVLWARV